ncbi:hypothetical protein ACRU43_12850 [Mycobacterium colombiense]
MRIPDELREALTPHLELKCEKPWGANPPHKPPTAVYGVVAGLVDPDKIEASIVKVRSAQQRTTWTVWLLTSSTLAHVRLGFAAELYDEFEEKDAFGTRGHVTAEVQRASVDSLSDVIRVELIPYPDEDKKIVQASLGWVPVPRMKLTCADGRELYLPGQRDVTNSEIDANEKFFAALRRNLPL